ncbi:hypothetical protein L211DRAFT_3852 [Terfezia boudieri ATCC MYA-4762]|uniref:Uncharacterized protein n=1 Tax=Terfezia boudieri ATCC MYA-4762 TaxID=1051890 RepID=A0A3N4M6I3_9PEZI|nr:hypothetical protein L211DRAFT_3852 [Terfezia boudieri ATCC MYA-4762]
MNPGPGLGPFRKIRKVRYLAITRLRADCGSITFLFTLTNPTQSARESGCPVLPHYLAITISPSPIFIFIFIYFYFYFYYIFLWKT